MCAGALKIFATYGRRKKGEGRREKGEGRREKGEGRRNIPETVLTKVSLSSSVILRELIS
jgi:hypothetical protein